MDELWETLKEMEGWCDKYGPPLDLTEEQIRALIAEDE